MFARFSHCTQSKQEGLKLFIGQYLCSLCVLLIFVQLKAMIVTRKLRIKIVKFLILKNCVAWINEARLFTVDVLIVQKFCKFSVLGFS